MSIIQSLRSVRIFNIALFDLIASLIGMYLLLRWFKPNRSKSFYISWVVVTVLPLAVVSHYIFNIPTMLNYYMGLSVYP